MDPQKSNPGQQSLTPAISVTGALGTGGSTVANDPPAGGFVISRPFSIGLGSIFKSVKSCTNLEHLSQQADQTDSAQGSLVDIAQSAGPASAPIGERRESNAQMQLGCAPLVVNNKPTRYGGMFRSVKSCAHLDQMGAAGSSPQSIPGGEQQGHQESGLLLGSLKSYLAKSNMVSAKDHNVIAPMSY